MQGFRGDEDLELVCQVEGDPVPKVSWYWEGTKLSNSIHYRISDSEPGKLRIPFMQPHFSGEYTCVADNLVGRDSAVMVLEFAGQYMQDLKIITSLGSLYSGLGQ